MIEEVWNKGNLAIIPELISSDYVETSGRGITIKGHEGIRQHVTSLCTAFPDFQMTIDEIVGEDDTLAVRLKWSGTFKEKIRGIKPTGRHVRIKEALFFRFDNGKQIEAIPFTDTLSLFQQMGVNPTN